jgi:hypothetical protein
MRRVVLPQIRTRDMKKNEEGSTEDLGLENEILKLKLTAQFGGKFGGSPDCPPEVENQFLKNILEWEEAYSKAKPIKLIKKLGDPYFPPLAQLEESRRAEFVQDLLELLAKHDIVVDFIHGPYPDEEVYRFITEELMHHEVDDMQIPGFTMHFIYEEFHPNHRADLTEIASVFIDCWIQRNLKGYQPPLSEFLLTPEGVKLTREEFHRKTDLFFDAFTKFELIEHNTSHVEFEMVEKDEELSGLGFVEGEITYKAILENGDVMKYSGGFKIFVSRRWDCWDINSFVIPGFVW